MTAIVLAALAAAACGPSCSDDGASAGAVRYTYEVAASYPHDPAAFTQGLFYRDGYLYESTGLYGESSLRRVDVETGRVLKEVELAPGYFGEGAAAAGDEIFQLTWREGRGFVYDLTSFELKRTFEYEGPGWGLTFDGERLVMSDGSATLRLLEPATFQELGRVEVRDAGGPVSSLNELEYVDGEIYANVWPTSRVARIDAGTGRVIQWLDFKDLPDWPANAPAADVLNGIAFDRAGGRVFLTGKRWPRLYEIKLVPAG